MSYESPVKLFIGEIKHQVDEKMEEACYTAVIEYFPHVDRAELLRALRYDRQQYEQGYRATGMPFVKRIWWKWCGVRIAFSVE